ncbi:hypothetical protein B0J11DRAFT_532974 [Dendryphion nanum]|uniref:DUF8035 domain-containing protein n=1 Tax=Dendryphion nanum TaxID=256645 RepID=A0A9P9DLU7_9PLEO|nr:hypothetical protein B0J11DRAFT_532974 [Dendryphion nanum]
MYRSSTGDLGFHDEPPRRGPPGGGSIGGGSSIGGGGPGGGERWDRDRFERMRGGRDEHDHYRFTEHDRFPGGHRDIDVHKDIDRRGPRVAERERFYEDERFDRPSRRRTELFEEPTPAEIANRALAPYRRKSVVEKDVDLAIRRPARPQYIRRQSSLDTFDRRPTQRYGEYDRREYDRREYDRRELDRESEWRPPTNTPIPLPIRERRRSPSRPAYRDDDFEEIRYEREQREPRGAEREEYREVEVRRSKSKRARSRSRAARSIAATSVRSSSASSFEEIEPVRANVGRRGKTRLPKRLAKVQAIIELGYPYEDEGDFIIVKRALEKEHIDEIIKISENYKEERTTYVYEEKQEIVDIPPPPPPPIQEFVAPPPPPQSVHYAHSVVAAPPPPPQSVHYAQSVLVAPPPPQSVHYAQSVRSVSPSRHGHEVYEERIEESNHIGGPLTVLVPEERREERRLVHRERDYRSEREIKDEIRALETERRMLKYERESDYEVIERREPRREVVRVEKDRKGRLALVRSAH